jgi:beta-glucanase (GH16 family)
MSRKLVFLIVISTAFFFTNCGKKGCTDPQASNYDSQAKRDNNSCEYNNVILPTNLVTTVASNEGLVEISASANGANFYTFTFYEGQNYETIQSSDGEASYTFSSSGNYQITTKAHTTYNDFISVTETVNIIINVSGGSIGNGIPTTGYSTPLSYPNYTLVWNDEFNGSSLSNDWGYDIGTGSWGWGNNELEYYRTENAVVDSGVLTITAKKENFGGQSYTSSRIKTQGIKSFKYGRVDIRAALPYGKGIWPALWMLGDNITTVSWPDCGEIDIMELIGGGSYNNRTVHGTIHWDNNGSYASYGGNNSLSSGIFAEEFHVFSIVWTSSSIKWLRDDIQYHEADISPAQLNEFQQNFFFIFNVAVGGNWPGSPDASTIFPQKMYVDYVRIFQ